MTNPFVVTINRQFGSGGREIGKRLAKTLDIAYLDKELLSLAAQKSGISERPLKKRMKNPKEVIYIPSPPQRTAILRCRSAIRMY